MAQHAQKKAKTERVFLFSSESVNEGHPDKICDQVSDAVLDACLVGDPKSKVACETATKDNMVMVAGEITTQTKIDYEKVVRGVVAKIGFDSFEDDLSSVDSKGLSDKTCEVLVRINKQSPDIAGGVHVGKEDLDVGAGDQGIMFGYATDETEDCMPLTHSVATKLGKTLTDVRKSGDLWCAAPIVSSANQEFSGFWAVGTNCCDARGGFVCDDAWSAEARSGMVVESDSRFEGHDRAQYLNAIRQAEVAFAIDSAEDPVLVRWVVDPEKVQNNLWWFGMGTFLAFAVAHLVFSCVLISFLRTGGVQNIL